MSPSGIGLNARETGEHVTLPEGVKVAAKRRPIRLTRRKEPLYWINLSRSGVPLRGIKSIASKMRRRK